MGGIFDGGGGGGGSTDIQVFSTPGAHVWTKPAGAAFVEIIAIGVLVAYTLWGLAIVWRV